jgi:hypothetical protein
MMDSSVVASHPDYPVTAGLNSPLEMARWRVIGNPILAIPHLIVLYVLRIAAGVVAFIAWFAILFTGEMPPGMGNFIAGVERYQWRVLSYYLFLREPYPTFSIPSGYADPGDDPASLQIVPPRGFNRVAVFFRFVLIIPLALWGIVLGIAMYAVLVVGWFAVLFTGGWPAGMRKFILDVTFWSIRVNAWYSLVADPYPPFSIG